MKAMSPIELAIFAAVFARQLNPMALGTSPSEWDKAVALDAALKVDPIRAHVAAALRESSNAVRWYQDYARHMKESGQ